MWKLFDGSGHNFAHAMTAELSWHVQDCGLIGSLESKFELKYFYDFSSISS